MTDRELMQMALDALECAKEAIEEWGSYASDYFKQKHNFDGDVDDCSAAIEALRARLAQPEKPQKTYTDVGEMFKDMGVHTEQEPVAWLDPDMGAAYTSEELPGDDHAAHGFEPLYTTPPQREWQGLTDEEAMEIEDKYPDKRWTIIQTEAKLKAKNA